MRVRILEEVEYEPSSDDARSCFGQLRKRPARIKGTVTFEDGSTATVTKTGPMVHYFPKGRTPELKEAVAQDFIARGIAEPFDGETVVEMSLGNMQTLVTPPKADK